MPGQRRGVDVKDFGSIKSMNIEKIKKYMRKQHRASKSEIARETKLSFPTVSRLLEELCVAGEMEEVGSHSTGGRSASVYAVNFGFSLCLLIRVEGACVHWKVADLAANVMDSGVADSGGGLLECLDRLILTLEQRHPKIRSIVIGISAMVSKGVIEETHSFKDLQGVNMVAHFQNLTEVPVQIENDMYFVVIGQWTRSRSRPSASVCIYYGEDGPGAGVLIDGEVWRGVANFAGELGFLPFYDGAQLRIGEIDAVAAYVDFIRIYAVVLNPDQVVLYDNSFIRDRVDEIRRRCAEVLPRNVVPLIELSSSFEEDYDNGLYATAMKRMAEL